MRTHLDTHGQRVRTGTQPSQRELSLTTTLITKLLTNALAQSRSAADSGDQSPASGPVYLTGRLPMAWNSMTINTLPLALLNSHV
jgi:hypothetical protein